MALTRKKRNILNPFLVEGTNILAEVDGIPPWLEDVLLGCIRSVRASDPVTGSTRNEVASPSKIGKIYKRLDEINNTDVQQAVVCSKRQATRYLKCIRLANKFILRHLDKVDVITVPEASDGYRDPASSYALGM